MLRIATSSHYIGFESLVNDIVEFSSLQEVAVFACPWFDSCTSQRSKAAWLSSVWVQAHADLVNQLPTSSVPSWDLDKEVSGVPGNS